VPFPLVVCDLKVEGLEDLALDLHRYGPECLGEVRDPLQLGDQLLILGLLPLGSDPGQRLLERLLLATCSRAIPRRTLPY
jgi:hypothetical protein